MEAVGGQSLSSKMRLAVAGDIRLINGFFYFKELMPEQKSSKQAKWGTLYIPPFMLLHMLDFLCSRHVETMRAQRALKDLQVLVHHDQGRVIELKSYKTSPGGSLGSVNKSQGTSRLPYTPSYSHLPNTHKIE